jgi:radical SAM superfamily enzyme YgiQ (UPF0313 family)
MMKKTLLVYPPFCTPASPPYSIANLNAFLSNNLPKEHEIKVIDLNIAFHTQKFPEYADFCRNISKSYDPWEYDNITNRYKLVTKEAYAESNKKVVNNQLPEMFNSMLKAITDEKPDIVAFSIIYSSQAFYAHALIRALKEQGITTVIGGPAVNQKLISIADTYLQNELELLEFIIGDKVDHNSLNFKTILDFNIFNLNNYFTPEPVIPIRTANTCFYQRCAFCTHHTGGAYLEFPLENIKGSLEKSGQKHVFITDDMIHKQRLLDIAAIMKPLGISWACQLKPTKDLDGKTIRTLHESGLKVAMWGVESASDRILELMRKGTNIEDITRLVQQSHSAGIKNIVYIMFGFPTETKEEAQETMAWLEENNENIDLISTSIFGLHKGTPIYEHPEKFCITDITETGRTILDARIEYEVSQGMSHQEAKDFRKRNIKRLEAINKFPRTMNFFREHMLCLS